jgi:hypothetical protein
MVFSAGLDESGRHSECTPKIFGRLAGGTGIPPGEGGLTGGKPGWLLFLCPPPMTPSVDRRLGSGFPAGGCWSGSEMDGWGASGRPSGGVGRCARSRSRPKSRIASKKDPPRTLLVIDLNQPKSSGHSRGPRQPPAILDADRASRRIKRDPITRGAVSA